VANLLLLMSNTLRSSAHRSRRWSTSDGTRIRVKSSEDLRARNMLMSWVKWEYPEYLIILQEAFANILDSTGRRRESFENQTLLQNAKEGIQKFEQDVICVDLRLSQPGCRRFKCSRLWYCAAGRLFPTNAKNRTAFHMPKIITQ
jgi:hypothetical protein